MTKKLVASVFMVVFLMGAGSLAIGAISDQWPMSEASWDAGNGTQGNYGNWYFKYAWSDQWSSSHWSGSTYANTTWRGSYWDVSGSADGSDSINRTTTLLWHPDYHGIIAWQAPETGDITLTASAVYSVPDYESRTPAIGLSIQKNYDTWLVGNTTFTATSTPQTASLYNGTVHVNQGDWLFFRTANYMSNCGEMADWSISIVPEPATMMLLLAGGMGLLRRRAV